MIVRLYFRSIGGKVFIGPYEGSTVSFKELEPIPKLLSQESEAKTRGNTITKVGSNEYLLLFHVVGRYGV